MAYSGKKYTMFTLAYYCALIPAIYILERIDPSGPCVPGLGMMIFMLSIVINLGALLFCVVARMIGKRSYTGPAIVHLLFFVAVAVGVF
jgi:hypothetical protein